MRIAVCFRGISRSLSYTIASIRDNVFAPAKNFGEVRVFTHLFDQAEINNPRTGEAGTLNPEEYQLLGSDWLVLEPPDECLEKYNFEHIKSFGDPWGDGFYSLRNVVHAPSFTEAELVSCPIVGCGCLSIFATGHVLPPELWANFAEDCKAAIRWIRCPFMGRLGRLQRYICLSKHGGGGTLLCGAH
jgi:hypothetical protein